MQDNWHRLYHYVSDRLCNDVIEMAQTSSRNIQRSVNIGIRSPVGPYIGVTRTSTQESTNNRYYLAERAWWILDKSGLISSLTETNEDLFICAELPLTMTSLPIMGLQHPVAWMYASYPDIDAGNIFVSLCGSIDNYIGFAPGEDSRGRGWYPSSSPGLHAIIEKLSQENEGAGKWARLMEEPGREEFYNLLSALGELPRAHVIYQGFVQVLAKVMFADNNIQIADNKPYGTHGHFDTVIVGAPLWVRSATAKPLGPDGRMPSGFEGSVEGIADTTSSDHKPDPKKRRWWRNS